MNALPHHFQQLSGHSMPTSTSVLNSTTSGGHDEHLRSPHVNGEEVAVHTWHNSARQNTEEKPSLVGSEDGALELPMPRKTKQKREKFQSEGTYSSNEQKPFATDSNRSVTSASAAVPEENSGKRSTLEGDSTPVSSGKRRLEADGWVGIGGGSGMARARVRDYSARSGASSVPDDLYSHLILEDCGPVAQDAALRVRSLSLRT